VVEDEVPGSVVFAKIEFAEFDWSVMIDGGVWMALVSDESTDEVWE